MSLGKLPEDRNSLLAQPFTQSTLSSVQSDMSSLVTGEPSISDSGTSISVPVEELFKNLDSSRANQSRIPPTSHRNNSTIAQEPKTWRKILTDEAYAALLARYDIFEMRRQEVIWELCRSESDFVVLLQTALQLSVQPLRAENNTR